MDQGQYIVLLIQTIVFLAPIVGIIWKAAGLAHDIKINARDIDGLGSKITSVISRQQADQEDLISKINLTSNNITEILTALQYMKKDIDDLKTEIKRIRR